MITPHASARLGLSRRQLGWFLFFRVVLVSLFVGGTIFYLIRGQDGLFHPSLPYLYFLVTAYYLQALVISAVIRNTRLFRLLVQVQVVWDLLFSTALIYVTRGTESLFSFLYLLLILGCSLLLSRRELLIVASASAILYGSLLDLQYYGYLPVLAGVKFPLDVNGREVFYMVFVNVVAFILVGLLGGSFAERLRRSELALERREVDFEELEQLNRTILQHIGSGLMIINPLGRIRAFNRAAEKIVGLQLREIYNRAAADVFPGLGFYKGEPREVERGEGRFVRPDGQELFIGFSSTFLPSRQRDDMNLLVSFQDLTHLRDMEARLQQADRLAAIGKMASGMAHEIRNPLASISGSLQLLIEGAQVTGEGERLAHIVVREADRLSALISDFLAFARPASPSKTDVDLSRLCDDVIAIAATDPRLKHVSIAKNYPGQAIYRVDREQLRQVLWNLLLNAGEAINGEGKLLISLEPERNLVRIEDSGPGIPEEIVAKIFDPFFSTKETGTGLGLATVYATLESHGAHIRVSRGDLGGACFELTFPVDRPRGDDA